MSVLARGVRNAFRNSVRTVSIVVILGLSVGLALTMLLARHAVQARIDFGPFSAPIVVIGTNDPTNLQTFGAGANVNLTAGAAFPAASNDNVALLGAGLATKNNLTAGSTFQAYGTDFTVAGIFDTGGNRFSDSTLVAPLRPFSGCRTRPTR